MTVFEYLSDLNVDICCFTETWLRKGDTSKISEIKELGYSIRHVSRAGRGGGVAVAYKNNINVTKNLFSRSFKTFEHIECLVKSSSNKQLRIISLYRSGTGLNANVSKFCDEFEDYLSYLTQVPGKLLITGDFNIHLEDQSHPDTIRFMSILSQFKLKQHIEESTHICGGILDLALTRDLINERLDINDIQVIKTSTTSDHFLIKFQSQFEHMRLTQKKVVNGRNLSKMDTDVFKSDIMSSDLSDSTKYLNASNAISIYNRELSKLIDKHAPLFEFTIKEDQPKWSNGQCQQARRTRRKFERAKESQKSEQSKAAYNVACKDAATVINTVRNTYYQKQLLLCENDKKKSYSVVNHLMNKNAYPSYNPKNQDDSSAAETLKTYFRDKIENIYKEFQSDEESCDDPLLSPGFNGLMFDQFNPIDKAQLIVTISELNKKECELDPIPVKLLLECIPELTDILLFIVNDSLLSGSFPNILKDALVRPTVKDIHGDLDDLKNYRPISNLPFLSKLLEKCVQKQLCSHLENNGLHGQFQSGYKTHHSCETATLSLYNDLLCLSDTRNKVILLLLDLSSAFDTVCHKNLLKKLHKNFGISGMVLEWFSSYLSERSFTVQINNAKSDKCFLRIGVPQGSILGPILFILYTKDLEEIAKRHGFSIHLYADDTQIYIEFSPLFDKFCNIESRIIDCFKDIKNWMQQNKLKINPTKTKSLVVQSRNSFDSGSNNIKAVQLGPSDFIKCSDVVKSLGVLIDKHLTFNDQIDKVIQSCNITLRNLWAIGSKLSFTLKKQLVHCLVLSKLDYCNGLYYNLPDFQLKRLQKIQNSCVRFLFGRRIKRFDRITPYLKEAHFLPIKQRITFKIALMAFKSLNNIVPNYLKSSISVKGQLNHSFRHESDFFLLDFPPLPNLKQTHRCFSQAAPSVWNTLPYNIRSCNDINVFKKNLKTHLFDIAFESKSF